MAADVKAPRIVRDTTNMERAAQAATAQAGSEDPRIIDLEHIYSDIEIVGTLILALEHFVCELQAIGDVNGKHRVEALGHVDTMAFEIKKAVHGVRTELLDFIRVAPAGTINVVVGAA